MKKDVKGTWIAEKSGDLNGTYYTYRVEVGGKINEACDPYARKTEIPGILYMVVNHVHNNADAVCVQGFYHLLHFFYPHFPVCRVGGVGAFRHIVIDRVIAPVKLFGVDIALVHGTEIIDRKQMHMGNAKFFDLVGLLDTETVNEIVKEVHKDHPNVVFYGEGWTMNTEVTKPGYTMATQVNSTQTPDFAYFSDTIRDLLKGSVFDHGIGYVSGAQGLERSVPCSIHIPACILHLPNFPR